MLRQNQSTATPDLHFSSPKQSNIQETFYLSVDVFPLFTAVDAFMQRLHTWLDVASKDAIKVNLFAASADYLIAQLNPQSHINPAVN